MWIQVKRTDDRARQLADRHYSRQTPGSPHFTQPGRTLVLLSDDDAAVWVTTWPYPHLVKHAWPDAFQCTLFRNESRYRSSDLINEAYERTVDFWSTLPPQGMVTFVDSSKVLPKKRPGECYLWAGFRHVGYTKKGLHVLQRATTAASACAVVGMSKPRTTGSGGIGKSCFSAHAMSGCGNEPCMCRRSGCRIW